MCLHEEDVQYMQKTLHIPHDSLLNNPKGGRIKIFEERLTPSKVGVLYLIHASK